MLSDKPTTKLFYAGAALTIGSTILTTCTVLHHTFIFLPHYYGSFANVLRQKPSLSLQPVLTYVQTPAGMALVALPVASFLAGLALMNLAIGVSKRISEREQKELAEQWMKENKTRKPKKSKSGRSKR